MSYEHLNFDKERLKASVEGTRLVRRALSPQDTTIGGQFDPSVVDPNSRFVKWQKPNVNHPRKTGGDGSGSFNVPSVYDGYIPSTPGAALLNRYGIPVMDGDGNFSQHYPTDEGVFGFQIPGDISPALYRRLADQLNYRAYAESLNPNGYGYWVNLITMLEVAEDLSACAQDISNFNGEFGPGYLDTLSPFTPFTSVKSMTPNSSLLIVGKERIIETEVALPYAFNLARQMGSVCAWKGDEEEHGLFIGGKADYTYLSLSDKIILYTYAKGRHGVTNTELDELTYSITSHSRELNSTISFEQLCFMVEDLLDVTDIDYKTGYDELFIQSAMSILDLKYGIQIQPSIAVLTLAHSPVLELATGSAYMNYMLELERGRKFKYSRFTYPDAPNTGTNHIIGVRPHYTLLDITGIREISWPDISS